MSNSTELLDVASATDSPSSSPAAEAPATGAAPARRRRAAGTGLAAMVLPELQAMATSLGIAGVGRMRKGQLIAAIQEVQGGQQAGQHGSQEAAPSDTRPQEAAQAESGPAGEDETAGRRSRQRPRRASRPAGEAGGDDTGQPLAADGGRQGEPQAAGGTDTGRDAAHRHRRAHRAAATTRQPQRRAAERTVVTAPGAGQPW